ncbi:transposase IS116/IS110/IS902 family protein [Natranaerovirga hydrolytica]|uniref:Transposase IS116/IS110/IS902 family protein n=1 Tax=Natranaerovirga hydrolytica TaxID=680378 RepID=A0A4R1MEB6_9FIRM|nr:IS110 family transposase [Natranaerovirga hydrolytica]TCK90555.1 transposase IS116/IS110/IS902 family protein [Natranaerovirga hydrolytica]
MKKIDYLSTLFVGIDIASRNNVVSAIDFHQEYFIKMKSVPNAQGGAELLEDMIADVLARHHQFRYVIIGLESTGFYGVHIANYLSSSSKLAPFSTHVYCLNPKEVANYKKSFNNLDKTDAIDSFVIADFARVGRISIKPWRGSQYLALQRLTRHRLHITECIAREKTYLLNNVFLKFSEFAMLKNDEHPFSNKYGATAEAILTDFMTNEDLVNASTEELISFINRKSRGRITNPAETASLLQAAARNSYRLDKCLYEPLTVSISSSFNCISAFNKELKAIDAAILQAVKGLNPVEYQVINSIPGIGKVFSAGILAEIGSIRCFQNNNALAKYCGIVWKANDSGDFSAENTPMSKAGNRYLRYYIIEATNSVIRHCPEYKAFYDKKYAEVTTHQHKRALALTSRKFIRMLFGLLDKSQLYSLDKSR